MIFDTLNSIIPLKVEASQHELSMPLYFGIWDNRHWGVRASFPGKHSDTDFVVEVYDTNHWANWNKFRHRDIFKDLTEKAAYHPDINGWWVEELLHVVKGSRSPKHMFPSECALPGLHMDALTHALQALTVCEYRRFPQGDRRGGGRYLPINYILAMLQGYWDADEASQSMRIGFPALRSLDGFVPFKHHNDPIKYVSEVHLPKTDAAQAA
jgi:hypothetical protein